MSSTNKPAFRQVLRAIIQSEFFLYLFLFIFALFIIFPYLWMFFTSFKPSAEVFTSNMQLLPRHWQIDNY
jgi:ABC-type glycerol-3-phosphate transport system permease component